MLRSIERGLQKSKEFLHSEKGRLVTGGILGGLFIAGNLHFQGISNEWAEALVKGTTYNFFETQKLLIRTSQAEGSHIVSSVLETYITSVGFVCGYIGGKSLTRRSIIWDDRLRFRS